MTRLQYLLSQIKTVNELAEILKESPVEIIDRIGVSKDREQLISCNHENCEKCAFYYYGHCTAGHHSKVKYLNANSLDTNHKPSAAVIAMRSNALENLQAKFNKACKEKADPLVSALMLDMFCDMLEDIGLFEPHECHNELIRITKEKHK